MLTMHTEVLKKVDLCVRSSTTALQQIEIAPFDGPTGDVPSFFVNEDAADESVGGQPLNIVENVSRRKFQYFYSASGRLVVSSAARIQAKRRGCIKMKFGPPK